MLLFILMDFRYLGFNYGLEDYSIISGTIFSLAIGYNNLFLIVGLVVTAIYIFGLNYTQTRIDAHLLIRYGKNSIVNRSIIDMIIDSLLLSTEFVGVMLIFCMIHFNNSFLMEIGFFNCCVLYVVSLSGYFLSVGMLALLVKLLLHLNRVYLIITTFIVFLVNGLDLIGIKVSPLYYSEFASEWFQLGAFDIGTYAFNLIKCFLISLWGYLFIRILLVKMDFMENEKDIN